MKTLTLNIATIAIAGLFSLSANAGDFSNLDYESYAESSVWPSHTVSKTQPATEDLSALDYESYAESSSFSGLGQSSVPTDIASINDIQNVIEQSPTASGSSSTFVGDLLGEDIYAQ